jgi:hypothetical protein
VAAPPADEPSIVSRSANGAAAADGPGGCRKPELVAASANSAFVEILEHSGSAPSVAVILCVADLRSVPIPSSVGHAILGTPPGISLDFQGVLPPLSAGNEYRVYF